MTKKRSGTVRVTRKQPAQSKAVNMILLVCAICFIVVFGYMRYRKTTELPVPIDINQVGVNDGHVTLTVSPATVTATPDTDVTLTITATTDDGYRAAVSVIEMTYDPTKVGTPVVTQGDYLTEVLEEVVVANGKIKFTYNAPLPEPGVTAGKTGSGTLATIKIRPTAAGSTSGTTSIAFTENTAVSVIGPDGAAIYGNMLKSANNVTITAGAGGPSASASPTTASANPSASPTQSPTASPLQSPDASPVQSPAASPVASPAQSPVASPTPTPSALPSRTTSLRNTGATCSSLAFGWDKIADAKGYVVDIADNSAFNNVISSGKLDKNTDAYSFGNLKSGAIYHVRVSQTDIHDFPRYTKLGSITTLNSCPTVAAAGASPKPSVKKITQLFRKASPKPSTSTTGELAPTPTPSFEPSNYVDPRFQDVDLATDETTEDPRTQSFFTRVIAWLVSLFE